LSLQGDFSKREAEQEALLTGDQITVWRLKQPVPRRKDHGLFWIWDPLTIKIGQLQLGPSALLPGHLKRTQYGLLPLRYPSGELTRDAGAGFFDVDLTRADPQEIYRHTKMLQFDGGAVNRVSDIYYCCRLESGADSRFCVAFVYVRHLTGSAYTALVGIYVFYTERVETTAQAPQAAEGEGKRQRLKALLSVIGMAGPSI
jgi:hypothetical protein